MPATRNATAVGGNARSASTRARPDFVIGSSGQLSSTHCAIARSIHARRRHVDEASRTGEQRNLAGGIRAGRGEANDDRIVREPDSLGTREIELDRAVGRMSPGRGHLLAFAAQSLDEPSAGIASADDEPVRHASSVE